MRLTSRSTATAAGAVILGLTLAACSFGGSGVPGSDDSAGSENEVEVFTWWAAGSEKAGLDALVGVFDDQHPDLEFVNGSVAGGAGTAAKDLLSTRLLAQDPPDTFQAHAGAELQDYIDAGQIQDVSNLYDEFGLNDAFPPDLVDRLRSEDGLIYSIPANIHRANVVWANTQVLKDNGIDPAATYDDLDDWMDDLDVLKEAGVTPLSVGTTWTQVNLLETVLLSDLGADGYTGLWDGSTDWTGKDVTHALKDFQKLMTYTNTDREGLDWTEATQQVIDGTAAFNVMGDWAVAAFEEQSKVYQTDFTAFPVPGTDGTFDYLADSFVLPVGAPHPDGAKAWLESVGSLDGQVAFNKAKGSIPARTDADPADFSKYQQSAMDSFTKDTIVSSLAHGAAAPSLTLVAISDATKTFVNGDSDLTQYQKDLATATQG